MRMTGAAMIGLGLALLVFACLGVRTQYSGVFNVGLLQAQELTFHAGLAAIVSGAILLGAGGIYERVFVSENHRPKATNDLGVAGAVGVVASMILFLVIAPMVSGKSEAGADGSSEARADNVEAETDNLMKAADEALRDGERLLNKR